MEKRQVVLVILDGWGIGPKNDSNPIYTQETPNLDYIKENFLIGALQASGISVGLPWGEEGNSEVGHLTIGAGKVLYQHYPRITLSIRDNSFAKNKVFLNAFEHAKKNQGALHLAGLLTEGNIHASFKHLIALIKLAQSGQVPNINLHIFSDGKDSEPKSALKLLDRLSKETNNAGKIASIAGRFYALDHDNHWERTKQAYLAMIGQGPMAASAESVLEKTYKKNLTDQHVEPHTLNPQSGIQDNDSLLFFDFREDGIRQLASVFLAENFSEFPVKKFQNLFIGTMTNYADKFKVAVAYPSETINNPLAKVLADNGKSQLHVAETEKYAHITYFFNGYQESPFPNEYRILVPSNPVLNHAEKPEMQATEITNRITQAIKEQSFDFILANYANADIIAHTGNYEAASLAIRAIDESIGTLIRTAIQYKTVLLITSDHGNVEIMLNPSTGEPTTTHDPSPVPIYIVGNKFIKPKSKTEIEIAEQKTVGILSDVAPTVLEIMNIPKPEEMTGQSLLDILK